MDKSLLFLFIASLSSTFPLYAQIPDRFSIVITELYPDPSPSNGLPNSEFIELKNISPAAINIHNWKISDGSSTAIINSNFILQPDSMVIICPSASSNSYAPYGETLGISGIPSLNNEADVITLYSPEGRIIHSVGYSDAWYQNALKAEGGWTLEMIDPHNPCGAGSNWKASINDIGGTPGTRNSIDRINKDEQFPALIRTYTIDSVTIVAVFDEPLDSLSAANSNNYQLNNMGTPQAATPLPPLFTEVKLWLNSVLTAGKIHSLIVKNVTDCAGNEIGVMNTAKAGLPAMPDTMDLVINEILFNPKTDGYDYAEFFNRSRNIIDGKQLYAANRNNLGGIINSKQLISQSFLFFPGEYLVITENKIWLQQNYTVRTPSQVIQMNALPSLPDDKGTLILMNSRGGIIDELTYEQQWHYALIGNKEGISLERMNYNEPTQDKTNWTSAASTAAFGTPTFQNSQFRADLQAQAQISISPKVFSPDNDGVDDFTSIQYQLTEPGYAATISIYDAAGRIVRSLVRNATLSSAGTFRWDGLNDQQQQLPTGIYVIFTEIFNLQGKTKKFKNVVTLGRRF